MVRISPVEITDSLLPVMALNESVSFRRDMWRSCPQQRGSWSKCAESYAKDALLTVGVFMKEMDLQSAAPGW
jgi:hypothetical protein